MCQPLGPHGNLPITEPKTRGEDVAPVQEGKELLEAKGLTAKAIFQQTEAGDWPPTCTQTAQQWGIHAAVRSLRENHRRPESFLKLRLESLS